MDKKKWQKATSMFTIQSSHNIYVARKKFIFLLKSDEFENFLNFCPFYPNIFVFLFAYSFSNNTRVYVHLHIPLNNSVYGGFDLHKHLLRNKYAFCVFNLQVL